MGHNRLQYPPDTVKFVRVVEAVADGADVSAVASATMDAAEKGLNLAKSDAGLAHAVWLMAHMTLAARESDFAAALAAKGIDLSADATAMDMVAAFSDAMDKHLGIHRSRTDIGEMAQLAAAESISALVGEQAKGLFGASLESVKNAVRSFSTKGGFADLSHSFFARFTERFLGYHLSRELSQHVGENQRFRDPAQHTVFLDRLGAHSRQVALIVKEFSAGWYSKSRFETGISERSARSFAAYSLTKIQQELKRRGRRHVG